MVHTAVYWGSPVPDGEGGRTFDPAVEITCRWLYRQEKYIDPEGRENVSTSVVYPDQDLEVGGYLYKGELDDLISGAGTDPFSVDGAHEIKSWTVSESIHGGGRVVRKAML
jgi:hypothetical protein